MRYTVTGAHRDSGQDMTLIIQARNFHEAEDCARGMGILVADVREFHEQNTSSEAPRPPIEPLSIATRHVGEHQAVSPYCPPSRPVQTIEKTGKVWKAQQLLSALVTLIGVCLIAGELSLNGAEDASGERLAIAVLMIAGGLLWFITARILAWWFHG
ncbi:MAG: hypothetical protein KAS72_09785 [Phycisphaerales bacterium]|nr:hypothetical protein [Phycisphaerales bacterium]